MISFLPYLRCYCQKRQIIDRSLGDHAARPMTEGVLWVSRLGRMGVFGQHTIVAMGTVATDDTVLAMKCGIISTHVVTAAQARTILADQSRYMRQW